MVLMSMAAKEELQQLQLVVLQLLHWAVMEVPLRTMAAELVGLLAELAEVTAELALAPQDLILVKMELKLIMSGMPVVAAELQKAPVEPEATEAEVTELAMVILLKTEPLELVEEQVA